MIAFRTLLIGCTPSLVNPHAKSRVQRRDLDPAAQSVWTLDPSRLLGHDHTSSVCDLLNLPREHPATRSATRRLTRYGALGPEPSRGLPTVHLCASRHGGQVNGQTHNRERAERVCRGVRGAKPLD